MAADYETKAYAEGYKAGFAAGHASGYTQGSTTGYDACKERAHLAIEITTDSIQLSRDTTRRLVNALETQIGRRL